MICAGSRGGTGVMARAFMFHALGGLTHGGLKAPRKGEYDIQSYGRHAERSCAELENCLHILIYQSCDSGGMMVAYC